MRGSRRGRPNGAKNRAEVMRNAQFVLQNQWDLPVDDCDRVLARYLEVNPSLKLPCGCYATRCPCCGRDFSLVLDFTQNCPEGREEHERAVRAALALWEEVLR